MWEEDVFPRALQNHLLQVKHLMTQLGLWMPQYAQAWAGKTTSSSSGSPEGFPLASS